MKHYVVRGSWAPYVGTDYCEYIGKYETEKQAFQAGEDYAWDVWEPQDEEETGMEDEGPDFWVEEYDPEKHDDLRTGGGSFKDDFYD